MAMLFLAGDVMTGRGIDQILPYPGDPILFENYTTSALNYVELAERAHGKIGKPADFFYIWGDALGELERRKPFPRIINLETAVTASRTPEPKGINYKMNPANVPVLTAARIDCCVLANNHVLDWGQPGLLDTLSALKTAGVRAAGAGGNLAEASRPAIIEVTPQCRVLVFGLGMTNSGIFPSWAAQMDRAGVRLLPDLSKDTAEALAAEVLGWKQPGDIAVISIHWGPNWGYDIATDQEMFARKLIDLGACDILHGHSSHHPIAMEIYRGKLILYGCGDFINDYEGIGGYEEYRDDLSVMYLPSVNEASGVLEALTLVLFQKHRFRLRRASFEDASWFHTVMNKECRRFATRLSLDGDGSFNVAPV